MNRYSVPSRIGSYSQKDVVFLLKDISTLALETSLEEREQAIQNGSHYSEMLPIEYKPPMPYIDLFYKSLEKYKRKIAVAVGVVVEQMVEKKGKNLILVSLARAGTPIGILMKRYLSYKYGIDVPHYSISIIRDRGIDENALKYILENHPNDHIQFIDGWTGKGAIKKELTIAIQRFNEKYEKNINHDLVVLADPGYCAEIYGTREDFLIPSACLNSTVSGLVSRTILNRKYISETDFHGVKYYKELEGEDVSNFFIDSITEQFSSVQQQTMKQLHETQLLYTRPTWKGIQDIQMIQEKFGIDNINLIKPGVGETTRVLLRRVPWKVLVKDKSNIDLQHIIFLAKERNVQIEVYKHMSYSCCGLIKPLGGSKV